MRTAFAVLACLVTSFAVATSVPRIELPELVKRSDHVLLATVTKVDMIDGDGKQVSARGARTGPGSPNTIRFHLDVEEVIYTTAPQPPREVIVSLWPMWHYQLGVINDQVTGSRGIFMLKGEEFDPAYPNAFQRDPAEREKIEELLKERIGAPGRS